MAKNKKATETYEALKKQFSEAVKRKASMAEQFKAGIAAVDAEIASLERQLNEGVSDIGFDAFQKAHEDLDVAFNKREMFEKQQKEFQKAPFIRNADYQAFNKSLSDERKAVEAAAEAEIFELLQPLAIVAEKYTTIINELITLKYVYTGCFGKEHGDTLGVFGFERYFPELLNDLNRLLSGSFNRYAKATGEEQAAICDMAELTNERRELLQHGNMLDFGGLPDTRIVDRII